MESWVSVGVRHLCWCAAKAGRIVKGRKRELADRLLHADVSQKVR